MTNSADPTAAPPRSQGAFRFAPSASAEWPTWLLIGAVYATWVAAVLAWKPLGPWAGAALLAVASCWYTSLQHELIHGHPTRHAWLNRLFGLAPLAVWVPYDLYRDSHLAHHRNERLTEPGVDPESNYLSEASFRRLPRALRPLRIVQRTVAGRVLLGPPMVVAGAANDLLRQFWRRDFSRCGTWLLHGALLAALLWALDRWAGIGPLRYLLTVAWPALGLAMVRSLHEHRPAADVAHRVVINEAGWFWRILYLNNNYHAVHHDHPRLPWHALRHAYLARRAEVLDRNGGFLVRGYLALIDRHWITPIDSPVHPMRLVDR